MSFLHRPFVLQQLARHLLCRVESSHDRFALTFDDGPSPRNTPQLLGVLERAGARATFFLLDRHARRHPGLVRQLVAAGHEVGIHGRLHLPHVVLPLRVLESELRHTKSAIESAASVRPRVYRAPFGLLRSSQARALRAMGYEPVLGDIYPNDPRCRSTKTIADRVLNRLRAGSIVILHDSSVFGDEDRSATIDAVALILEEAANSGLSATSVSNLQRSVCRGEHSGRSAKSLTT